MIQVQQATVYYSPAKRKRYLTLKSAVSAEANAIIFERYPTEAFDRYTGDGYHFPQEEPGRYAKIHRRLSRLIKQELTAHKGI